MDNRRKTKEQLVEELAWCRQRVAELKAVEAECGLLQQSLREGEERYRLFIENIPDVVWVTDQQGNTIYISPQVEKVY